MTKREFKKKREILRVEILPIGFADLLARLHKGVWRDAFLKKTRHTAPFREPFRKLDKVELPSGATDRWPLRKFEAGDISLLSPSFPE